MKKTEKVAALRARVRELQEWMDRASDVYGRGNCPHYSTNQGLLHEARKELSRLADPEYYQAAYGSAQ